MAFNNEQLNHTQTTHNPHPNAHSVSSKTPPTTPITSHPEAQGGTSKSDNPANNENVESAPGVSCPTNSPGGNFGSPSPPAFMTGKYGRSIGDLDSDSDDQLPQTPAKDKNRNTPKHKLFDSDDDKHQLSPPVSDKLKLRKVMSLEMISAIKTAVKEELKSTVKSIQFYVRKQTKDLKDTMIASNFRLSTGPSLLQLTAKLGVAIPIQTGDEYREYDERLKDEAEQRDGVLSSLKKKFNTTLILQE